jgi:hypothetical protein
MKEFKSDLVLLFEASSGWKLEDYLYDRASKCWSWAMIADEMNISIVRLLTSQDKASKLLRLKIVKDGLFRVNEKNLGRWYSRWGIKSKVKPGRKQKKGKKNAI